MLRGAFTARRYASAVYAVMRCLSVLPAVRPSVTFVDHVKTNKHILDFFSPSGNHTFLVRQNVLKYLNNFTKQHCAVSQL